MLMVYSGVLIHFAGGLAEVHFHIFVSMAFLVLYYDWQTATRRRSSAAWPPSPLRVQLSTEPVASYGSDIIGQTAAQTNRLLATLRRTVRNYENARAGLTNLVDDVRLTAEKVASATAHLEDSSTQAASTASEVVSASGDRVGWRPPRRHRARSGRMWRLPNSDRPSTVSPRARRTSRGRSRLPIRRRVRYRTAWRAWPGGR